MPTNRRRRVPRRRFDARRELDVSQRYHLIYGRGFFRGDFTDDEDMVNAWREHEDTLTREFLEENPGRRPFMWWFLIGVPTYGERIPPLQEDESDFLRRHRVIGDREWRLVKAERKQEQLDADELP